MATLQTIRNKFSWILLAMIGMAMLAFILMDLMSSSGSILQRDANTIVEINGEKINSQDFFARVQARIDAYITQSGDNALNNISRDQFVDIAYDELIREKLMGAEYEKLGIVVTAAELWERIIVNPSVIEVPVFQNEQGMFDPERVKQYLSAVEQQKATNPQAMDEWNRWLAFEKDIMRTAVDAKYNLLITSGMMATTMEAKQGFMDRSEVRAIQYVYKPYNAIADSTITVSDGDLKKYYNTHKEEKYKQDAMVDIEYVLFDIVPSKKDVDNAMDEFNAMMQDKVVYNNETKANDTIPGFINTDEDSVFINANSDISRFTGAYTKLGELPAAFDTLMHNASVGFIYGPYVENNVITAAKLLDKRSIPDSVRASHILIAFVGAERANPNVTRNFQQAEALADSLFEVVKGDASNFAAYAVTYSDDGSAGNGGDLDWFKQGMMTRPFNDYCFQNNKGEIGLVRSEFGFHIIQITNQGGSNPAVKVGIVDMRVLAGNETEDQFYLSSNKLAGESKTIEQFRSGALAMGKEARPAAGIREADRNVPGIANSRSIVRWGFSETVKEGAVQISELEGKIVVAFLVRKREEGFTPLDDIKEQVRAEVLKEKKAEKIMAEFKGASGKSIEELATANGLQAQNLTDLRFTNPSLMGIGYEPKVVGAIFGAKENVVTGPIKGESGVFVVKVVSVNRPTETGDLAVEKQSLQSTYTNRASSSVFEALKENAKIEDRRAKFY